jgi:hypothetical protein
MRAIAARLQHVACAGPGTDSMTFRATDDEVSGHGVWTLFPRPGMRRAQPELFYMDRARGALLGELRRIYGVDCVVQIVGGRVRVAHGDGIVWFDSPLAPIAGRARNAVSREIRSPLRRDGEGGLKIAVDQNRVAIICDTGSCLETDQGPCP